MTDVAEITPEITPAMLARELVAVYDLLDRALRLALARLEDGAVEMTDQASFWRLFHELDQLVWPDDRALNTWLYLERPDNIEAPLTDRRREIEHLRRLLAGENKAEDA